MTFSHERVSLFKKTYANREGQDHTSSRLGRNHSNSKLQAEKIYMHYNNAIYMGTMTSYKRNGQGMILLDDGTSGIIETCYDTLVGHNIFFRDNEIASVLYRSRGSFEIVYRTQSFILKLPYVDHEDLVSGSGELIDFSSMKIYHLIY